jgi:hypothetical protein
MTQPLVGTAISPAALVWTDATGNVQSFDFDLVLAEEWEQGATVTEHPVEQGANVADHVRVELVKVMLTVFATNEPLGSNNFTGAPLVGQPLVAKVWQSNIGLRGLIQGVGGGVGAAIGGTVGNVVGAVAGAALASLIPPGQEVDTPFVASVYKPLTPGDFVALTITLLLALKNAAQLITVEGSKQTVKNMVIEQLSYVRSQDEGTGATITLGLKQVRVVQTQAVGAPLPAIPRASPPVSKGAQNPTQAAVPDSWLTGIANWAGMGATPHP